MEEKETFEQFQYIGSVHPVLYDPYKECYYETHKNVLCISSARCCAFRFYS